MAIDWDSEDEQDDSSELSQEVDDARAAAIEAAIQLAILRWRALKQEFGLD